MSTSIGSGVGVVMGTVKGGVVSLAEGVVVANISINSCKVGIECLNVLTLQSISLLASNSRLLLPNEFWLGNK